MRKLRSQKSSILFYMAAGLGYLTVFLAILCFWQTKEIRYLVENRQSEYRILGAAEAEAALLAYENGAPHAEVYHALRSAADYCAMDGTAYAAVVSEIGARYLENGVLGTEDHLVLQKLSDGEAPPPLAESEADGAEPVLSDASEAIAVCRRMAEKIVGVRGICRQVYVENGGGVVLFSFDNGYIRMRLRDAIPLEWAFSYPRTKGERQPRTMLEQKAARSIPDVALTIRDVRAAEDGYWMHFSGKPGSGRLFIRAIDGRVTAFITDPVG